MDIEYGTSTSSVIVYTDESAAIQFAEEEAWGMLDLLEHEVYLLDGEININFWFSEAATNVQVDRARSFVIRTFLLRRPFQLGRQPYDRLVRNMNINWNTLSSKIFLDGELVHHDRYDENLDPIK